MFELASQPTWFIKMRMWICTQIIAVVIVSLVFTVITVPLYCSTTVKKLNAKISAKGNANMSTLTIRDWISIVLILVSLWWFMRTCSALYHKFVGKTSSLDKYMDQHRELMAELMRRGAYGPQPTFRERVKDGLKKLNPLNWFRKDQP